MLALTVLAILAFGILPLVGWVFKLGFHLIGWSMRLVFGVLLLPLWIVIAVVGGLAAAGSVLIPIAIVFVVLSMINAEG